LNHGRLVLAVILALAVPPGVKSAGAFTLGDNNFHVVGDARQSSVKLVFDSFVTESLPKNIGSWGKNPGSFTFHEETILLFPKTNKPKDIGNIAYLALANGKTYRDVGRVEVVEKKIEDGRDLYYRVDSIKVFDKNNIDIPVSEEGSSIFRCTIEGANAGKYSGILCIEARKRDGGLHSRTLEIRMNYPPGKPKVPLGSCKGPNLVKDLDGGDVFRACGQAGFTPGGKPKDKKKAETKKSGEEGT